MTSSLQTVSLTASPVVIKAYGELTNDFNPIHVDPEFAGKSPMGGCIAHGTMSLCLLWESLFRTFGEAESGVELDVRFIRPVRVGETVHAGGELQSGESQSYAVWVRGDDGLDRVTGTVRLLPGGAST